LELILAAIPVKDASLMKALSLVVASVFLAGRAAIAQPANDLFANAIQLSGSSLTVTGSNVGATAEPGESEHDGDNPARASVWYQWTAPADGFATIRTAGSTFDTVLAVYQAVSVTPFRDLGYNDDAGDVTDGTSRVRFQASAGVTYSIAVDGFFGDTGDIVLSLELVTGLTVPVNDNFTNAIPLTGTNVVVDANNYLATMEPGEFNFQGDGCNSVWWTWIAPTTDHYGITTIGSDFDTRLVVTTDTTFVDWSDDDVGWLAGVHFKTTVGTRYHIGVQGFGADVGAVHLSIQPEPLVPAPDWTLTDMNGQVWRLSDFSGKVVMLDFWATWCGPCVGEIPDFIAMQNQYGKDGFQIIGVSTDESGFDVVTPFVNSNGVNYISTLTTPQIEQDYGPLTAIPVTYIINRQGMIEVRLLGSRSRETFESYLLPLIYPAAEVTLQASRDGNDLVLSWPITAMGYSLESSTDLSSATNWTAGINVTVSGDLNVARAPIREQRRWFRLVHN
jgi:thiol-disulfide isomerase/thioredoxin